MIWGRVDKKQTARRAQYQRGAMIWGLFTGLEVTLSGSAEYSTFKGRLLPPAAVTTLKKDDIFRCPIISCQGLWRKVYSLDSDH